MQRCIPSSASSLLHNASAMSKSYLTGMHSTKDWRLQGRIDPNPPWTSFFPELCRANAVLLECYVQVSNAATLWSSCVMKYTKVETLDVCEGFFREMTDSHSSWHVAARTSFGSEMERLGWHFEAVEAKKTMLMPFRSKRPMCRWQWTLKDMPTQRQHLRTQKKQRASWHWFIDFKTLLLFLWHFLRMSPWSSSFGSAGAPSSTKSYGTRGLLQLWDS